MFQQTYMNGKINILTTSAVYNEAADFIKNGNFNYQNGLYVCETDFFAISLIISGVGGANATYYLTKITTEKKFDLLLDFGVCGIYGNNEEMIGKIVCPDKAYFADYGFENRPDGTFKPLDNDGISINLANKFSNLFNVETGAVNTRCFPSTDEKNLERVLKFFPAKYETMESAYCANVCKLQKINYLELRCISNTIEKNCNGKWNLSTAFFNLGRFMFDIFFGNNSETFFNFVKSENKVF